MQTHTTKNLADVECVVRSKVQCRMNITNVTFERFINARLFFVPSRPPKMPQPAQSTPCKHPVIVLQDVAFTDLHALVEFIYHGEVNVHQRSLSSFLKTAEVLRVSGLTQQQAEDSHNVSVGGTGGRMVAMGVLTVCSVLFCSVHFCSWPTFSGWPTPAAGHRSIRTTRASPTKWSRTPCSIRRPRRRRICTPRPTVSAAGASRQRPLSMR